MRKPVDYVSTCKEFKEVFGLDFREYVDTEFLILGELAVDIVRFGDWIDSKHGIKDGTSIKEATQAFYGERGLKLITDLM